MEEINLGDASFDIVRYSLINGVRAVDTRSTMTEWVQSLLVTHISINNPQRIAVKRTVGGVIITAHNNILSPTCQITMNINHRDVLQAHAFLDGALCGVVRDYDYLIQTKLPYFTTETLIAIENFTEAQAAKEYTSTFVMTTRLLELLPWMM